MTTPGHGNEINLAALWVPVMPETSHMGEEMRKAGQESKRQFEQGFNSGASPEAMGSSFGSKLQKSISNEFRHFELPYGASGFLDKFSSDVDEKLVKKLKGEATQALQAYRTEFDKLSEAQARATQAEGKLAAARELGLNKASFMIPLIRENTTAQNTLTEAQAKAGGALDIYNTKNAALSEEMGKVASGGKIMAGILGGAIVIGAQLAVHAVESFVEAVAEGFEKSIELTVELGKAAVELGEKYEHIGIQIHEFSTATGEDFEKTEAAAQHIFSTLDVAGNDVGKTMAQLSSIMGVQGEDIQSLVRNVTELQGRYTTLRATDLGSSFRAFKVPAEEADRALASLLQSARGSGQDLGQLASSLSGNVAITLHEAGLNIEQAGKFTAELMAMGEPGRQAMTGMAMAMKEFGLEGVSFSDGMRHAGEELNRLGDTAAGQDLAQKLFGARNWIVAKDAVQNYLDIINQAPDAFSATTASTQEFLDQTATLGNKVEEFKHKAEDAFKPFGDAAKNAALTGLNSISNWFTLHHTEIIQKIKGWGDKLIELLPTIQEWIANAIEMGGAFAQALLFMFQPVATTLAAAGAGFLALSGHFKDAKDLLVMTAQFDPSKIGNMAKTLADGVRNIKYDTGEIKDNWDEIADAAGRMPTQVGTGLGTGLGGPGETGFGAPGFGMPGPGGSFGLGGPNTPWFPGPGGGGGSGAAPAPGPPVGPGGHHADWDAIAQKESGGEWNKIFTTGVPLGGGLQIKPETWYEFGGLAFTQYAYQATKEQQIAIAERILNGWGTVAGQGPKAWENGDTYVERKQLGGPIGTAEISQDPRDTHWGWGPRDPFGRNPTRSDIPGRGITGGPSWGPGGPKGRDDIHFPSEPWFPFDPWRAHRKGVHAFQHGGPIPLDPNWAAPGDPGYIDPSTVGQNPYYRGGTPHGLFDLHPGAESGWQPGLLQGSSPLWQWPGANFMYHAKGGPSGTDTVPAWLTPGEYVWDTDTVDKHGWLISALHKGFQAGGEVGEDPHRGNSGVLQVIYSNTATGQKTGEAGGAFVGPGTSQPGYYGKDWEGHTGHVHTSFATSPYGEFYGLPKGTDIRQGQSGFPAWVYAVGAAFGVEASTYAGHQEGSGYNRGIDWWPKGHADMSGSSYTPEEKQRLQNFASSIASYGVASSQAGTPSAWAATQPLSSGPSGGDYGPSQYPGMPGQYGGYGAYGGETADQREALAKAVREANDRKADLDHQVVVNQRAVDDLKAKIANVGVSDKLDAFGKPYPLTPAEQAQLPDKRKKLNEQLDDATATLAKSTREAGEAQGDIATATRKEAEGAYKKPSGTTASQQPHAVGEAAFQQLGSSFLSGIGQELGFGDLFSKPPWEWGAVKLLTGVAGWAMGTANAWSDAIISGKTTEAGPFQGAQSGGSGIGDILSGFTGSLGLSLPKASVSNGPNIVPGSLPIASGQGTGPAPGPGIVNNDNSIHVASDVDPSKVLAPVHELQNSNNASLHGQTGGMPQ
jgi:hypothetical protein